ncbi:hypothetical protein PVAR5_3071 [Paecilomyces variotii No. 5]|uniref:Uncharacterized protein n=1 Tax=Byssochlamys spectabilis (strain No. 5 / NBRC 109023) TaxID=1356009 RepID=V5HX59_BYSSN|nr:hypothetical protein PVAR5_3071 [Paecilomyces variotii No. 5]
MTALRVEGATSIETNLKADGVFSMMESEYGLWTTRPAGAPSPGRQVAIWVRRGPPEGDGGTRQDKVCDSNRLPVLGNGSGQWSASTAAAGRALDVPGETQPRVGIDTRAFISLDAPAGTAGEMMRTNCSNPGIPGAGSNDRGRTTLLAAEPAPNAISRRIDDEKQCLMELLLAIRRCFGQGIIPARLARSVQLASLSSFVLGAQKASAHATGAHLQKHLCLFSMRCWTTVILDTYKDAIALARLARVSLMDSYHFQESTGNGNGLLSQEFSGEARGRAEQLATLESDGPWSMEIVMGKSARAIWAQCVKTVRTSLGPGHAEFPAMELLSTQSSSSIENVPSIIQPQRELLSYPRALEVYFYEGFGARTELTQVSYQYFLDYIYR